MFDLPPLNSTTKLKASLQFSFEVFKFLAVLLAHQWMAKWAKNIAAEIDQEQQNGPTDTMNAKEKRKKKAAGSDIRQNALGTDDQEGGQ